MTAAAVYDGTRLLGKVDQMAGGEWQAFDANGKPLGASPTRIEAAAVVTRADRLKSLPQATQEALAAYVSRGRHVDAAPDADGY